MGARVQPLIEAAQRLTLEEREELLDALLGLVDPSHDIEPADLDAWTARAAALDNGEVEGIDAEDAIAAARAELKPLTRRPCPSP